MDVSTQIWIITVVAVFGVYTLDFIVAARNPHEVSMGEAGKWVAVYSGAAVIFGGWIWIKYGSQYGSEFYAGWITEYSLSVDNLFIFVLIMESFAVPRIYQQKVLQIGIIGALVLRFGFILLGAALLAKLSWLFYIFGAFLIYTAVKLVWNHLHPSEEQSFDKIVTRMEKVVPLTSDYHGASFSTKIGGKRFYTPLAVVMVAIFMTDLLFALDSIPAIFGLTEQTYIVFTANAFALMGLRQLYFLLDGLLDRLIYLTYGLAVILGFIGVKLLLHAAHESGFHVPEITTAFSLAVIIVTLVITVICSLVAVKRNPDLVGHPPAHSDHPGDSLGDVRDHASEE